jgi:hypothetical protein
VKDVNSTVVGRKVRPRYGIQKAGMFKKYIWGVK